jgi:branched-chain amino acid transport system substrate-binding protein
MMKGRLPKMTVSIRLILVLVVISMAMTACGPTPAPVEVTKIVEVTKEVVKEVEVTKEVVVTPTPVPEATAPPPPEAPATIKIGTVTDQTGPLAAFGVQTKWGYSKAADEINAEGGIYVAEYDKKIPVEILWGDHSADEQKAVTEMEYLVEQGVVALSGTTALMPLGQVVAEKNGVPLVIANGSLVDPFQQGFRYLFDIGWMNTDCAKWPFELIDWFPEPKPTMIGFMEEQNLMGIDYSIWFQKEAFDRGATNIVIQKYQRFGGDFSTQILAFKEAGVDFVYAPMIGPDGIKFWQQMKELDFVPKAILMLSAPAVRADWLSMGADADYVITTNAYHWATGYPGAAEFDEAYAAEHDGEHAPELAGQAYAAIQVIADAIERAGSLDHDKVRDALTTTDLDTIEGHITFNANGTVNKEYFLVQYIDGVETIVWPEEMAEREPVYPFPAWTER